MRTQALQKKAWVNNMKSKSWLTFISVGVLIIIAIGVLVPYGVNKLMFIDGGKVAGDKNTWISFLGTFIGAIVGGIISGALTVYGVYLTIKRQTMLDLQNKFPNILLKGRKVTNMMNQFLILVKGYNETGDRQYKLRDYVNEIIEKQELLLEWSLEISADAFYDVSGFLQAMNQLKLEYEESTTRDELGGFIQNNVSLDRLNSFASGTSKAVSKINKIIDNYAEKYYKDRY
jgi:hypothetical protein